MNKYNAFWNLEYHGTIIYMNKTTCKPALEVVMPSAGHKDQRR